MVPPSGIDSIPTQRARLVSAPLWVIVMPSCSASSTGTKWKYPTTPALNEPHMRPAVMTGARIRRGGKWKKRSSETVRGGVARPWSGGARWSRRPVPAPKLSERPPCL